MYYDTNKVMMTNKCISSAGHFDGHGGAPEQYRWHCPMRHVQGRATLEATGPWHQATTRSVLLQRPPGHQANKQQSTNTPRKLTVLMAMVMRRYVTARINQWRRSRALLEATGHRHWVSIMSNNIKGTWLRRFFSMLLIIKP
jgi:hypothetical protein